jgi:hypothetical protein
MGPLRATDRIAGWRLGTPPRLGLPRLIDLLRAGDYGQLRVSR